MAHSSENGQSIIVLTEPQLFMLQHLCGAVYICKTRAYMLS